MFLKTNEEETFGNIMMLLCFKCNLSVCVRESYQSEGAQHTETLDIGQAELHEAEADDDAVEDVPARLEVVVRIQSDDLQHHLCCEDPREHLTHTRTHREGFKQTHQEMCNNTCMFLLMFDCRTDILIRLGEYLILS